MYKSQSTSLQSQHQESSGSVDMALLMPQPNRVLQHLPMLFIGMLLIVTFALAGNLVGRNASAQDESPSPSLSPPSGDLITAPGDFSTPNTLLPITGDNFTTINITDLRRQTITADGKGDLDAPATPVVVAAVPPPLPKLRPYNLMRQASYEKVKIIPAAVDLKDEQEVAPAVTRIVTTPALPANIAKRTPTPKQQSVAQRRIKQAEENCLARAVYFESRSESDLGQLAVAKVILNRVKNPDYPKTICGVVYQGSANRNSCQFSFACDGLPDDVKSPEDWSHARRIAERAINKDAAISRLGNALNYHADYVTPRWAHGMRRLMRIGHHIFYAARG